MQFSGIPSEIVMIIQALVIFFVATLQVLKVYIGKKKAKGGVK
jgi:simple sugar transport system permease protein